MFNARSFWIDAAWLAGEAAGLLLSFTLVFAGASRITGKPLAQDVPTIVFMVVYFCTAMRLKGVSL